MLQSNADLEKERWQAEEKRKQAEREAKEKRWQIKGATENAIPDIARPSKLWRLTSRDWTTRHHMARVDIARLVSLCE